MKATARRKEGEEDSCKDVNNMCLNNSFPQKTLSNLFGGGGRKDDCGGFDVASVSSSRQEKNTRQDSGRHIEDDFQIAEAEIRLRRVNIGSNSPLMSK